MFHCRRPLSTTSTTSTTTTTTSPMPSFLYQPDDHDNDQSPPAVGWSLTKICATIGPTSEQFDVLQPLVREGLRIMRLNFSHATVDEVELRVKNLSACEGKHTAGLPSRLQDTVGTNLRATLLDTRGPEIRTGTLRDDESGHQTMVLEAGALIRLDTTDARRDAGSTPQDLYVDYARLSSCVQPGSKVLLDDGAVVLTVVEVASSQAAVVTCRVDHTGELRSRAGVNLPGADTDLPALTEKDRADIRYGLSKDVDYVAASFVCHAEHVHEVRRYVREVMTEDLQLPLDAPAPLIISKIETAAGLANFPAILAASDGIMVARGDLGVEIPLSHVTNAQKEMVAACNAAGKPVMVATQMLESMAKHPRPTRAEVADVTNAVYDGADCVMTSGETAKGKYPVETLAVMDEIVRNAERYERARPEVVRRGSTNLTTGYNNAPIVDPHCRFSSLARAAVVAAERPSVTAILVTTTEGRLPQLVAGFRPHVPIVAFCASAKMGRRLMIHRAVHPVVVSTDTSTSTALRDVVSMGFCQTGDDVVIVSVGVENKEKESGSNSSAIMTIATVP